MVAEIGDVSAVGRELGIVSGACAGVGHFCAGGFGGVVEPELAAGVKEDVGGVGGDVVVRGVIAIAMVAIFFVDLGLHDGSAAWRAGRGRRFFRRRD